jgi:hypothetical protein
MTKNAVNLIREGKLRTGTVDICLDPDLIAEYEQLTEARSVVRHAEFDSLAGPRTVDLDEDIEALGSRIEDATITLKFTALTRPRFRELVDKFPPRTDEDGKTTHKEDLIGVNFDEFYAALIRTSIVEPELTEDDLTTLLDQRMSDRDYQAITDLLWDLNRSRADIPFTLRGSQRTRS